MARPYTPKVGRHVTYFTSAGKPRPATITAVGSTNGGIVLRIGRTGGTAGDGTTGILRRTPNGTAAKNNVWSPA